MNNANNTKNYYTAKQGRLPVFISEMLNISDPVLAFDRMMEEMEIAKYLKVSPYTGGRRGYNQVNMLKTILFGFMDRGYMSLREIEDECRVNIRYMYLMDYETPSCVCRRKNRTCTEIEPHLHGRRTAVFNIAFRGCYVENFCDSLP